jgi:hypothetical protein
VFRPHCDDVRHALFFFAYGCPLLLIQLWLGVLTHHHHQVKTSHGVSTGSYSYTTESPIHGPGQRSTGGSGCCVLSTSFLLHALDRLAHGVQFCEPTQMRLYINKAAMFIDDNTSTANKFHQWLHIQPDRTTSSPTNRKMLRLEIVGLLKLRQCLYYAMHWQFDSEGRPSLTITNFPH